MESQSRVEAHSLPLLGCKLPLLLDAMVWVETMPGSGQSDDEPLAVLSPTPTPICEAFLPPSRHRSLLQALVAPSSLISLCCPVQFPGLAEGQALQIITKGEVISYSSAETLLQDTVEANPERIDQRATLIHNLEHVNLSPFFWLFVD